MTRIRMIGFMLLSVILLLPAIVQADMVFDFQMKLAQKGNAEAQFKVGEMYESGFGVEKDLKEAKSWVSKAASKGHETAGYKLLYWDIEKNGLTNANKINVGSLKAKAKQGNAQAAYYLGKMYSRGIGFKRNSSSAAKWLNKAALSGVAEAETELVIVRERQQKQLATKRLFEEKKRAELKAKQERDRLARLEQSRKLNAQKRAQQLAAENKAKAQEKAKAEEIARKNRELENRRREIALANEKLAKEKAAEEKRQLALQKERERQAKVLARKKALLKKQREEAAAKQKASFESDPCSGKSARFLSTCR